MLFTELGMERMAREMQPANAYFEIYVIEPGIETEDRDLHL